MAKKSKKQFSRLIEPTSASGKINASRKITSQLVAHIVEMSKFEEMKQEEVNEQLYKWEPEVGGSIDRIATLVTEAYQGFVIKRVPDAIDVENIKKEELPDGEDQANVDDVEKRCVQYATMIAEGMEIRDWIEAFTELLMIHGNVYLKDEGISFELIPNDCVTLLDTPSRITNPDPTKVIKKGNILVVDEGLDTQEIIDKFMHIKFKKTPIYVTDNRGRKTYNVYSISPLNRTILPVWQKRQSMIIDLLWRWSNVPREHHKLSSESFTLDKFEGTWDQRRMSAEKAAEAALDKYVNAITSKVPDQAYVTLDNTTIDTVETRTSHLDTNDLVEQYDNKIWTSMNIPKSIVNGQGSSSYAAEVMIGNYVTTKILQLGEKIKKPLLKVVRERIKKIDPTLPVQKLDIKFDLVLASSKLELFRELAIMASVGLFTDTELRELVGYMPLTDDQKKDMVKAMREKSINDVVRDANQQVGMTRDYPETPYSENSHARDRGQEAVYDAERQL